MELGGMPRDEARASRDADHAHSRRWAVWHHQFDLVRAVDGVRYLRRHWIVKTPFGGIILHRMDGPDARDTLHDHPFSFVSLVLRGGYIENRLRPRSMTVYPHVVTRWNVMRKHDAHTIVELLDEPTWTLLFVGRHVRTWGFLEDEAYLPYAAEGTPTLRWRWTKHDAYDSGHYVPERDS